MLLNRIVLNNIKRYKNHTIIELHNDSFLNTVSGKNGSGKSTIFESIMLLQKAFFVDLLEPEDVLNLDIISSDEPSHRQKVAREIASLASDRQASISLTITFSDIDLNNVGIHLSMTEDHSVTLTLNASKITGLTCEWSISTDCQKEKEILLNFWNLQDPSNIIVMLNADKNVYEEDFGYDKINLISGKNNSPIIDFVLDPKNIYQHMYDIMMNAYLYERLNPQKPRNDDFVHKSMAMFSEIMDGIAISNFSGKEIENQFILIAKNIMPSHKNVKYDARNLSSGEKLIWYVLLILNYLKNIGLLIIDEPENHLHEQLAWKFVLSLQEIFEKEDYHIKIGQVFLITHSKSLIYNNFSIGINYITDNNGLTPVSKEECETILRNCGISFVEDKVLFVEGKTETDNLSDLCNQYNIKIKMLGNCTEILQVYNSLTKVKELVTVPKFVFILDRDTRSDSKIQKLREDDPNYFDKHISFLPVHEIENFLLDEQIIATILNNFLQDVSEEQIDPMIISNKMKDFANESLEITKKKYLNYELDTYIKGLSKRVNQRNIIVSSKDDFSNYVKDLLSENVIEEFINNMTIKFDNMEQEYNHTQWDNNWKTICDGKIVFNRTCSYFGNLYGIKDTILKKKIFNAVLKDNESQFTYFWNNIIEKLQ